MKKIIRIVILVIIILIMGTLLYIHDVKSSSSKIERFCYQDLFLKLGSKSGDENKNFSSIIKYEYFSEEYHKIISEEEYLKINTIEEVARLFNNIDITIDINSFNDHRYLNTEKFKTPVGNSYIMDDKKCITIFYNLIIGIENGNSVIKKLNVEIIENPS